MFVSTLKRKGVVPCVMSLRFQRKMLDAKKVIHGWWVFFTVLMELSKNLLRNFKLASAFEKLLSEPAPLKLQGVYFCRSPGLQI